ncbi:MAG: hypothetical protein Q9192_000920 [Flavoplaca navasiana]
MVQSNRHSPVAPQHRSPIYSPPALPPTSRSNPTIIQSDDEFEALVEEIVERQPSLSPDPLSPALIFEPWPRLQMISYPATPVATTEETHPCPLLARGCECTALGGHASCLFLCGETEPREDTGGYSRHEALNIFSALRPYNSLDTLGLKDHPGLSLYSKQIEPNSGYLGFSILPGTSLDGPPQQTYSDPATFEETAFSAYRTSSIQTQYLSPTYSDNDLDPLALLASGSAAPQSELHGPVNQSSSGLAKSMNKGVNGSTRKPVRPISGLASPGPEGPQENHESTKAADPIALHYIHQSRRRHRSISQSNYTEEEKQWVVYYLKGEVSRRNLTESKWDNISRELLRHGLRRSKCSIKAWWSRYGREETGFDERQNPNGRNLVTSRQDPEDRKKARRLKKQRFKGKITENCCGSNVFSKPRL